MVAVRSCNDVYIETYINLVKRRSGKVVKKLVSSGSEGNNQID
jgi:hypothetical protein